VRLNTRELRPLSLPSSFAISLPLPLTLFLSFKVAFLVHAHIGERNHS